MCQVSVIIPNYNHGKYLFKRIQSVLDQTFDDFEVIILDDCSTDDSRSIIEKFREHEKVSHIVFNKQNSGNTFKQWNKGFELARGEYIWIAESDDYCKPDFLQTLMPALMADKNIFLGYCQSVFVDDSGKVLKTTIVDKAEEVVDGREFVLEKMMGGNGIPNASMAVFKKSQIKNVEPGYTQMRYCGDWFFWTQICRGGKVFISGEPLNFYRRHDANVTSRATAEGLDFIEGWQIFDSVKKLSPTKKQFDNAIGERIKFYFKVKNSYSRDVNKKVIKSLQRIKPDIQKDLRKAALKKLVKKAKTYVYRIAKN